MKLVSWFWIYEGKLGIYKGNGGIYKGKGGRYKDKCNIQQLTDGTASSVDTSLPIGGDDSPSKDDAAATAATVSTGATAHLDAGAGFFRGLFRPIFENDDDCSIGVVLMDWMDAV